MARHERRFPRAMNLAILLLVAFCAGACSSAEAIADPPEELALVDAEPTTTTAAPSTTTSIATTTTSTIPPDPFRTWTATAKPHIHYLTVFEEPDGAVYPLPFVVPNPHQFGGPMTLMIVEGEAGDDWVKVQLPVRPNGQEAWIPAADYEIGQTRIRAEVELASSTVRVFDGDELIAETLAVMGAAATPTPLGTFYVAAKKENSESEYYLGPSALVLSGFSEALETFSGGLPVIAVHGTHRPEQIGDHRSNGCIRVPNDVIDFLTEHVPVGAPVTISV